MTLIKEYRVVLPCSVEEVSNLFSSYYNIDTRSNVINGCFKSLLECLGLLVLKTG